MGQLNGQGRKALSALAFTAPTPLNVEGHRDEIQAP
jgi:hypothetical protein